MITVGGIDDIVVSIAAVNSRIAGNCAHGGVIDCRSQIVSVDCELNIDGVIVNHIGEWIGESGRIVTRNLSSVNSYNINVVAFSRGDDK